MTTELAWDGSGLTACLEAQGLPSKIELAPEDQRKLFDGNTEKLLNIKLS